jgi:hypothetical protein
VFAQNVIIKGKTESYFSNKKIKNVQIDISIKDSIINTSISKGTYKIPISAQGIIKVSFKKEGYIDKYFLINTKDIPKYYLEKKYTIKADVSIIKKDKYMEDNTIENAVAYAYFNKKYNGFIWDPEYTKKAQVAMDVKIFPLESVVKLDSSLNRKGKTYFFRNGINYYVNIELNPEQLFSEQINTESASKIKYPVIQGYLYGKFMYQIIQNDLNALNKAHSKIRSNSKPYSSVSEGLKDCKILDTLILQDKYAAIGYWLHLVNYADTAQIEIFCKIAIQLKKIEKHFVNITMTDAELSFYTDIKNTSKRAIQLEQLVSSLKDYEKKDSQFYQEAFLAFKKQVRNLSRNCELTQEP